MIPNLPNLLPTANTGSFLNNDTTAFSGTPDGKGGQFDDLMAQALAPFAGRQNSPAGENAGGAGTEAASFQGQPKIFQSGPPAAGADEAKEISTPSTAAADSEEHLEANGIADEAENIPVTSLTTTMMQALSPFAEWQNSAARQNVNGTRTDASSFQGRPKLFQPGPPTSGAADAKKIGAQPNAEASSTERLEARGIAGEAENNPIKGLTPTMTQALSPFAEPQNFVAGQNASGAQTGAGSFRAHPEVSQSTGVGHRKEISTSPNAGTGSAAHLEAKKIAGNAENIPVQSLAPVMVQASGPSSESKNSAASQNMAATGTDTVSFRGQPAISNAGLAKVNAEAGLMAGNTGNIPVQNRTATLEKAVTPAKKPQNPVAGQNMSGAGTAAGTNSAEHMETSATVVDPGMVSIQFPPLTAGLDGLNMRMAPAVSAANGSAGMMTALAGVKTLSAIPAKISGQKLSPNHPDPAANSIVKAERPEKTALADETSAGDKTDPAVSKAAGPTPTNPEALPVANDGTVDLKAPKAPVESVAADSSQSNLSILPDSDAKTPASIQSVINGTPAAQQDVSMKSAEKTNKTTDPAGNFLPGSVVPPVPGNNLPSRTDQATTTGMANVSAQGGPATVTATATDPVANPSAGNLSSQSMERTHDMVTMHALRLSNMSADSLQVVIKPGAGTQISLELRQRGNGVEAQAVLQQGDFNHLNQRWSELQQRLEQRGIRLAPLTDDSSSANNGGTSEHKRNQPGGPPGELAFASPASVKFAQPTVRATAQRGWETWA